MFTIDHLVRAQVHLGIMMGYRQATRGADIYTYALLMKDLNTVLPGSVRNVQQMTNVMTGRMEVPLFWGKLVDELLEQAVTGRIHPPTPGPFWSPPPMTRAEWSIAGARLHRWMVSQRMSCTGLAVLAEITARRISKLCASEATILPTEVERLADVFGTDRGGFFRGPE